jgi:endonuclease-3
LVSTLSPTQIIDLLSREYGRPLWRPHRDPTAELVLTVLSQNTSDTNSGRAFARLLDTFPDWPAVMNADIRHLEEAIRPGGLAPTKAPRIQALLGEVWHRLGSFDLSFLADLPLEEARSWLRSLPGVGPKTAACVLLFSLGRPALPVDTHVHRVARRLGLVPPKASAEKAHELLEARLRPEEVYPFHIALVKHGRRTCLAQRPRCPSCALRHGCPSAPLFYPVDSEPTMAGRRRR